MKTLRAWLILGRVSNLPTVWTNVLAAWLLAGGDFAFGAELAWLMLGASLLYVGGTTLNDYFDVAFDREFRKERPIPSGVLSRNAVGLACLAYGVAGALAIGLGAGGSWLYVACLIAAIVLYDYRHKEWVGSVFVMGACRLFLSLLAGSCVTAAFSWPVMIHAGCLFAYIVGLSFVARGESRQARIVLWPLLLLGAPLVGALYLGWETELLALAMVVGCFLGAVSASLRALSTRTDPARIGKSVGLMLASIALADALFLVAFGWQAALLGFLGFVLALGFQKVVPAT